MGRLLLVSDGQALTGLYPESHRDVPAVSDHWRRDDTFFTGVVDQLLEYFAGRLTDFDVALSLDGTPFQRKIWAALQAIPYGQTRSYGEIALAAGSPKGSRAVGVSAAKNPISIIVPCHRVVGADGELTGYAGGLEMKQRLLDLESASNDRGWQTTWTTCRIGARPTPMRATSMLQLR